MHWPKKRKLKWAENSFAFATCFWVTQTASRIVGNAPAAARGYEWREREPVNIKWTHRVLPGSLLRCSCLCLLSPRIWRISRSPCLALSFTPPQLHSCTLNVELFPTVPNCNSIHSAMSDGAAELTKRKMWRERVKGKYFRDTNRPQDVFLAGKYGLYSGILSGIRLLHEWI